VLQVRLAGQMPALPSQNSSLRAALLADGAYSEVLARIGEQLGAWIAQGQAEGSIDRRLPAQAVLYTLYSRACDPVVEFLRAGGRHPDEQIVSIVVSTCFDGLSAR